MNKEIRKQGLLLVWDSKQWEQALSLTLLPALGGLSSHWAPCLASVGKRLPLFCREKEDMWTGKGRTERRARGPIALQAFILSGSKQFPESKRATADSSDTKVIHNPPFRIFPFGSCCGTNRCRFVQNNHIPGNPGY